MFQLDTYQLIYFISTDKAVLRPALNPLTMAKAETTLFVSGQIYRNIDWTTLGFVRTRHFVSPVMNLGATLGKLLLGTCRSSKNATVSLPNCPIASADPFRNFSLTWSTRWSFGMSHIFFLSLVASHNIQRIENILHLALRASSGRRT